MALTITNHLVRSAAGYGVVVAGGLRGEEDEQA